MKKKVLITGGTGFVGANLARRLLEQGHTVNLLVRKEYMPWRIEAIMDDVTLFTVDLTDKRSVGAVVNKIRPEWIFHLAAFGAYSWQTDIHKMIQTNFVSTVNLIDACIDSGFESFINTGSSSEYGFKSFPPSEDAFIEPNSSYAVTKASATLYCNHIGMSKGCNLCTLRLYSAYGPFEDPYRLIPNFIIKGFKGLLPSMTSPETSRDFVYIDDVCDAYVLAASKNSSPGSVYNVGTGVQTSLKQAVAAVCEVMQLKAEPEWNAVKARSWDTNVWVCDNSRIKSQLGWKPEYSFKQGFRETLDWFKANPKEKELYCKALGVGK